MPNQASENGAAPGAAPANLNSGSARGYRIRRLATAASTVLLTTGVRPLQYYGVLPPMLQPDAMASNVSKNKATGDLIAIFYGKVCLDHDHVTLLGLGEESRAMGSV